MDRKELEKLPAPKLRILAKQFPEIQGVHAMKKEQLVEALLKAQGESGVKLKEKPPEIQELKKQIKKLKEQKLEALQKNDKKQVELLRKKIKKLKRKTRRLAQLRI